MFLFNAEDKLTHCGEHAKWIDCDEHDSDCFAVKCDVCGLVDKDCDL